MTERTKAHKRCAEIEYQQDSKSFVSPSKQTVSESLVDFVSLYSEQKWGASTYQASTSLISNYNETGGYVYSAAPENALGGMRRACAKKQVFAAYKHYQRFGHCSGRLLHIHRQGDFPRLVLKSPKTTFSKRRVWLPKTLAYILQDWQAAQMKQKELLGDEYIDYGLVVAQPNERPCEPKLIDNEFNRLKKRPGCRMWFSILFDIPARLTI